MPKFSQSYFSKTLPPPHHPPSTNLLHKSPLERWLIVSCKQWERQMFQPTHSNLQRSYKLVGGGWWVPVASLTHSPSLFIQLAVVMKEKKKRKKNFHNWSLWTLSVASNGLQEQADQASPISICVFFLCHRRTDKPDEMGTQTISSWCCPCSLKSLMEYISSWNATVSLTPCITRVSKCRNPHPFFMKHVQTNSCCGTKRLQSTILDFCPVFQLCSSAHQ